MLVAVVVVEGLASLTSFLLLGEVLSTLCKPRTQIHLSVLLVALLLLASSFPIKLY